MIVFLDDNPFRRPVASDKWSRALEPLCWPEFPPMSVPAQVTLPALPAEPKISDLAELTIEQLALMVANKYAGGGQTHLDTDVQLVSVKPAVGSDCSEVEVIDVSDDEVHDLVPWEERGYTEDTLQNDVLVGVRGQQLPHPLRAPGMQSLIDLAYASPAELATRLLSMDAKNSKAPAGVQLTLAETAEEAGDAELEVGPTPKRKRKHGDANSAPKSKSKGKLAPLEVPENTPIELPPVTPPAAPEASGLPDEWVIKVHIVSRGKTEGAKHKYYHAPDGRSFRTLGAAKGYAAALKLPADTPLPLTPPVPWEERCAVCASKVPLTKDSFKLDVADDCIAFMNSLPTELLPTKLITGKVSVCMKARCGSRVEVNWDKRFVRLDQCCHGPMAWPTGAKTRNLRVDDYSSKEELLETIRTQLCTCRIQCFCNAV